MTKLETAFTLELLKNLEEAERLTGIAEPRLKAQAQRSGGAAAVRQLLRRGQTARQFQALKELGRLELSPEYLVTQGRFGPLFTDEEANQCLEALLEAGAFSGDNNFK